MRLSYPNPFPVSPPTSLRLILPLPHLPFPHPPFPLSLPLPIIPLPHCSLKSSYGVCRSAVSSLSRSGQSPAAKRILVQWRLSKLGIWRRVEGRAKWVNIFINLLNLQWGAGSDPESETAVVLTDSITGRLYQGYFEQFNHISRSEMMLIRQSVIKRQLTCLSIISLAVTQAIIIGCSR